MGNENVNGLEEPQAAGEEDVVLEQTSPHAEELERLTEELEHTRERLLRSAAELQNFRRRTGREKAEWRRRAQMNVLDAMVTVLDDFRRALDATGEASFESLEQGVNLVYRNFADALRRFGVEPLEAVGKPFDENLHEAVLRMPAPEGTEPGVVVQEIRKGYRMGSSVLRHTQVVVATEPPQTAS